MTKAVDNRQVAAYNNPSAALSYDISDLVVYNEQVRLSYQYVNSDGVVLNPVGIPLAQADWEIVESDLLLTPSGAQSVYDNRLPSAETVRVTVDSTIRPAPVAQNTLPNLNAEQLQEELTKRDLQDAYVLESGSVEPGTIHGDNIVDGSIRGSKLASNSVGSTAIADGAITRPKLADGAVDASKVAPGVLYRPGVADPTNMSTLDLTEERDGSENTGDFVFLTGSNTAKKLTAVALSQDRGFVPVTGQLGRYAMGLVRRQDGTDVKIAAVDGAIVSGLSLIAGQAYSLTDAGALKVWAAGEFQVGVALDTSRLMLKRG